MAVNNPAPRILSAETAVKVSKDMVGESYYPTNIALSLVDFHAKWPNFIEDLEKFLEFAKTSREEIMRRQND